MRGMRLGVDLALAVEAPIAWPESLAADEPFRRFNYLSPFRKPDALVNRFETWRTCIEHLHYVRITSPIRPGEQLVRASHAECQVAQRCGWTSWCFLHQVILGNTILGKAGEGVFSQSQIAAAAARSSAVSANLAWFSMGALFQFS